MVKSAEPVKRSYSSPLRTRQADETKRRVVIESLRLFSERGFFATSFDDIAKAAGVSRATVFSVGTKAEILRQAYGYAITGDDDPTPLVERPASRAVRASTDGATYLEAYASLSADVSERTGRVHDALRAGAQADPDVAYVLATVEAQRRGGALTIATDVDERGGLRNGLDRRTAADIVSVLNDPPLYVRFVVERRWSKRKFRVWLAAQLRAELIGD